MSDEQEATYPVELWVYDLSNGLARQLSVPFLGKAIDAVYHTSVVVHGKEYFYGQGILTTDPGMSHHGAPLERLDMGSTQIDKETFEALLDDLQDRYTAASYHLLQNNCNHFSNELVSILTGEERVPKDIIELPSLFLSTPMGRMMAGHIDTLFPTAPVTSSAAAAETSKAPDAVTVPSSTTTAAATDSVGASDSSAFLTTASTTADPARTTVVESMVNHVAHEAYNPSASEQSSQDQSQPVPPSPDDPTEECTT